MNSNFKAYLMLIFCAFFWSGNFIVGKFATLYEVPPLTLNFFRWLIVWFILIPFTLRDLLKNIKVIKKNFYSILLMSFTRCALFKRAVNTGLISKLLFLKIVASGVMIFFSTVSSI